jgi:hypothetical protein
LLLGKVKVQEAVLFTPEVGQVTVRPGMSVGVRGVEDEFTVIALLPPMLVVAVLVPVVVPTPTGVVKDPVEVKAALAVPPPLSIVTVMFPLYDTPDGAPVACPLHVTLPPAVIVLGVQVKFEI